MPTPEFVHKVTPDIVAEQIEKLRRLFPVVITEDEGGPRVDFGRLRATLGDHPLAASTPAAGVLSCA